MKQSKGKTWKDLVQDVIDRLPRTFSLPDVLLFRDDLAREYPDNRFIEAKIRQTLQLLRDQGVLKFLGGGKYSKLDRSPTMSLCINTDVATGFISRAQIARVTLETWAELNLYCLSCTCDRLRRLPANTVLADFSCPRCARTYQLKAKDGRFAAVVQGAAYRPLIEAAKALALPDYVLAEYDTRWSMMSWVRAIPGSLIDESRISARSPLRETAKRAHWVGAMINVGGLPSVDVVAPKAEDRNVARSLWHSIRDPA